MVQTQNIDTISAKAHLDTVQGNTVAGKDSINDIDGQAKLVIVEGNIAAGKSTLCKTLSDKLNFVLFKEPVNDNPYLASFYEDPHTYGPIMQKWLFSQRLNAYKEALEHIETTGQGVILDRSVFSDWAFAYQSYVDGFFTDAQYTEYLSMRDAALEGLPLPTLCVYLDASPATCHYRITELRKRECEAGIPLEYIEGLDAAHGLLLTDLEKAGIEVLRVDWDSFGDVGDIQTKVRESPLAVRHWATPQAEVRQTRLAV